MQVTITGKLTDSSGALASGTIEFSQMQRLDTGEFLVTSAPAVARVQLGELNTLSGEPFKLPSNPEGTAVRILENLGGLTFEWWASVPETDSVAYKDLTPVESSSIPESVWGPPPWLSAVDQARDDIVQAIADGAAIADALGGVAGMNDLVNQAAGYASDSASAAARAEAAADSIDPDDINQRFENVGLELATKVDQNQLSKVARSGSARAFINHKRNGSLSYEVIRVTGVGGISKIQAPGFLPNGTVPRANRRTVKQFSREFGLGALVNADASMTVDATYARMHGINITGGVPYASFGDSPPLGIPGTAAFDTEAVALYTDGVMRRIARTDNKTASQYVADGVSDTFGHGPVLVNNGARTNWHTNPGYAEFVNTVSARTIVGQASNGDIIIITTHGKTGSYGIAGVAMSDLAIAEGCVVAVNCDGGGSTQGIWNGYTYHASTDNTFERGLMQVIGITAPQVNEFDTGSYSFPVTAAVKQSSLLMPAMSLRAIGERVFAEFNLGANTPATLAKNAWIKVSDTPVPEFLCPRSFQESRGAISAGAGDQLTASLADDRSIYIRDNGTSNKNLATGSISWPLRDYLGDRS